MHRNFIGGLAATSRRALARLGFAAALAALAASSPALALEPALAPATSSGAGTVTIFAAASLRNALDEIAAAWKRQGGKEIAISYAASFPLARQIESGAPADLFMSADEKSMDYLSERKLIVPATRSNLLGNELVVVAPKTAAFDQLELTAAAFDKALAGGRLAMGEPASVPAGKYGQSALETLGLWTSLQGRLALADNVRSALLYVSRGETPLGIVYETDAHAAPDTKIVATFPANTHAPIVYPMARTSSSTSEEAAKFQAFLTGPEAAAAFTRQGFRLLAK